MSEEPISIILRPQDSEGVAEDVRESMRTGNRVLVMKIAEPSLQVTAGAMNPVPAIPTADPEKFADFLDQVEDA